MWALLVEDSGGNVREALRGEWNECLRKAFYLPRDGFAFHSIVKLPAAPAAADEYVTLDAVLGRGRHQEDSGCDLGKAL